MPLLIRNKLVSGLRKSANFHGGIDHRRNLFWDSELSPNDHRFC